MMVRFELTRRPPPSPLSSDPVVTPISPAGGKQQPANQLLLEPSRILHPRFDPAVAGQGGQTTGKGLWVTCWSEAVEALARKGSGAFVLSRASSYPESWDLTRCFPSFVIIDRFRAGSYKRLHPSASMPAPALVCAQVESQLARRVVQEIELLAERIKSWPVASRGGPISSWEDVPVQIVSRKDIHAGGIGRLGLGLRVIAALDLAPSESSAQSGPICDFVPSTPDEAATVEANAVPVYRLSQFFRSALLPPDSLSSFRPRPETPDQTSEAKLLAVAREPVETMLALLARRFQREGGDATSAVEAGGAEAAGSSNATGQGDMILLVAPRNPLTEAEKTRAEVVVPLAVALRRLRLWTGEEWTEAPGAN